MYVTRPLSMYIRDPSALSLPPPDGPNSGVLVIQDEEDVSTCCFGLCKSNQVANLPFPQNMNLRVQFTKQAGEHRHVSINRVVFIPVMNQPLSSNQYYCIERKGRNTGEAYKNSKEEDKTTCCFFFTCIIDLKPQPLDPQDIYQQFEITRRDWGGFVAKSVAPDGFPPHFLRRKGWRVYTSSPRDFELNEASGLDKTIRACLPDFSFPLSEGSSPPVIVGKWYCPFMFIKDGALKDQMDRSRFHEMTLEQKWERIFTCENNHKTGNAVAVDLVVETEAVAVGGEEILHDEKKVVDGVVWFRGLDIVGGEASVGLSLAIVERMKWEQVRFGWIDGYERKVRVTKLEEFGGIGEWKKFGCYVLIESFVLKRMDGSLVLTCEFRHTQHIRTKWE
eukprot:XP_002514528.2 uncharacterized protein LOC8264524 [Ricinus communis]